MVDVAVQIVVEIPFQWKMSAETDLTGDPAMTGVLVLIDGTKAFWIIFSIPHK